MKNQSNYVRHLHGLILALIGLITAGGVLLGQASLVFAQTAAPSWSYTGNLNTARDGHVATLLQNGKVLIVGGAASAELYDPEIGTWSTTGSLNVGFALFSDTATLLQNGKVLFAGGTDDDDGGPGFVSTEVYDPSIGSWSVTGSLNTARFRHTATVLPNGHVLVAGGAARFAPPNTPQL